MVQNGLLEHAAALLTELHVNTWFSVEAIKGVIKTTMGTLAGHPVADLMFALADAEVDDYYHEQLRNDDLLVHVPTAGVEDRWGCDGNVAENMPLVLQVRRPAYCDDAIAPIIAPAPQLVAKVAAAAVHAQASFARFGFAD